MEGEKLLSTALEAGAEVESLFVARDEALPQPVVALLERAAMIGVRIFELAPGVVERVSDTVTPQPVLGVVRKPRSSPQWLAHSTFVVACVAIRDPGNVGAVVRAADASGADGLICSEGTVDVFNPKAVRASAGSVLRLPLLRGGAPGDVVDDLRRSGLRTLGATAHGGTPCSKLELTSPVAIVLGNEASGLPSSVSDSLDATVTVPMHGGVESLNVSMAAAVLLFEVARQRSYNLRPHADAARTRRQG
jgi:RNA methyltransferase, TrmH family